MTASAAIAAPGHNAGPATEAEALRLRLKEEYAALLTRAAALTETEAKLPTINTEDLAKRATDYRDQVRKCTAALEAAHKAAKEPFLEAGRVVDSTLLAVSKGLKELNIRISLLLGAYQEDKAEAERKVRAAEAERLAEDARKKEAAALAAMETAPAATAEAALDTAIAAQGQVAAAEAAAQAPASELGRVHGDFGATASLRKEWKHKDVDRATLNLEALRPYLPMDGIDTAIRAYIKAGGRKLDGCVIFDRPISR